MFAFVAEVEHVEILRVVHEGVPALMDVQVAVSVAQGISGGFGN